MGKQAPAKLSEEEKSVFSRRLTLLMRERELTHIQVASGTGFQRQTISLYVNDQSKPDCDRLSIIARFFNVSTDWLLGLSDVRAIDATAKAAAEYTGLTEKAVVALHDFCTKTNDWITRLAEFSEVAGSPFDRNDPKNYIESVGFLNSAICALIDTGLLLSVAEYEKLYRWYFEEELEKEIEAGGYREWLKKYTLQNGRAVLTEEQTLEFLRIRIKDQIVDIFDDYCADICLEYPIDKVIEVEGLRLEKEVSKHSKRREEKDGDTHATQE